MGSMSSRSRATASLTDRHANPLRKQSMYNCSGLSVPCPCLEFYMHTSCTNIAKHVKVMEHDRERSGVQLGLCSTCRHMNADSSCSQMGIGKIVMRPEGGSPRPDGEVNCLCCGFMIPQRNSVPLLVQRCPPKKSQCAIVMYAFFRDLLLMVGDRSALDPIRAGEPWMNAKQALLTRYQACQQIVTRS